MRWLVCIMLFVALPTWGQRTTKRALKVAAEAVVVVDTLAFDTIYNSVDTLAVKVSGYEKMLRSRRENAFVTNNLSSPIAGLALEIEYLDSRERQLHKRVVPIKCHIPEGETRMVGFSSWDKQQAWYYAKSEPPRTRFQATPYYVRIKVVYVVARADVFTGNS